MSDTPLWALVEAAILAGGTRDVVAHRVRQQMAESGAPEPTDAELAACYVEIVDKWLTNAAATDEEVHAYHVRLRQHLYQRAYQINDYKTCLAIAADLAKLQAQYNRQRAIRQRREESSERRVRALTAIKGGRA